MVTLKGSPKGIMISADNAVFETAKEELIKKLTESQTFFKGAKMNVYLTSNTLSEAELFQLRSTIKEVLSETDISFSEEPPMIVPQRYTPPEPLGEDESITELYCGSVAAGETLTFENSVVITGNVEAGAKIQAGKHIFVLGALYGTVFAGANGDGKAVVAAGRLMPERLKIAEVSVKIKKSIWKKTFYKGPELAYMKGNKICVKRYW